MERLRFVCRIEFRAVGRQTKQPDIARDWHTLAFVPARTVKYHDDVLVGIAFADLCQEQRHTLTVDMGQHQRVKVALRDTHRTIGVNILMGEHGFYRRPQWELGPAIATIADSPKAGLILKHQAQWLLVGKCAQSLRQVGAEFF